MTKTEPQEVAPVFGIVRRKSRSELVRQELGQSMEHFRQAAAHAAQGTSATVGPRVSAARDRVQPAAGRVKDVATSGWGSAVTALAPLAAAATDSTRRAGKDAKKTGEDARTSARASRKANAKAAAKLQRKAGKAVARRKSGGRSGKLTGLLLVGAVVGAGAAYAAKRRQAAQWDEYDPSRPIAATEPAGTSAVASADPTPTSSFAEPSTVYGDRNPTTTATGRDGVDIETTIGDQTSSALHNPEVARLAGGGHNPNKI